MRRFILAITFVLAAAVSTEAATITIITTPEQDAALVTLMQKLNKDRVISLTAQQFKDYIVAQWLDGLVAQAGQHSQTTIREAWEKADAATRAKVKTDLGLKEER